MERSYEGKKAGQQRNAVLEFCDDPADPLGKLDSGHWNWLGVRERKGTVTFVLGPPTTSRAIELRAMGTVRYLGEPINDDTFRVTVQSPGTIAS